VPHLPGAFVCNVGDLCERWTNGVFKSTVHRVVTAGACERYSCAFFWEPNFETAVEPLPQCVSDSRPAKYPPTTYGEYILGKYAETHSGISAAAAAVVVSSP
jgi:isopenicillin N synthase-like dioxygenase